MLTLSLFVIFCFLSIAFAKDSKLKASSVFRADEVQMHKYSAILAATEPTRLQSQKQIKSSVNSLQNFWFQLRGVPLLKQASPIRSKNKGVDVACSNYERRVESALRSYGMNVDDFNDITQQINAQSHLKHKILKQAYYYKVAADLEENLKPVTPLFPTLGGGFALLRFKLDESLDADRLNKPFGKDSSQITRFSHALLNIEKERLRQRNILQTDLNIRKLPKSIGDPELQAAMSPVIQKTVEMFPKVVSGIIQENGLFVDEFHELYAKLNNNPFFRWSVESELRKITKK